MKKGLILLILLIFPWSVYPFWIWSPKTQKWKNPKYSALSTPYLQYKAALKVFEEGRYKEAYKEFKKLLSNYPDAKEAAESQYYLGRCLEKFDKSYEAFLAYKILIDSYPNSQRINEAIERQYNIGEYFLNREHKKWLGLSLYDFVEHPSIEILNTLVKKAPYSEYAPRAQYKLGIILFELGRFDEARDAFQKVVDNYSDTEWAAPAKYQLAIATSKAFPGVDYDSSYLEEATTRLDEFIKDHPEAKISDEAEDQLKVLRNREAKKNFDIAQFYESQDQYKSAAIYYRKVVDDYIDSDYYDSSLEKIKELNQLIEGNLTKKDLIVRRKKDEAEAKRADKIRRSIRKREKKEEIRENKIERKKRLRQEAKRAKELKISQKLAIKAEKWARSQAIREEKLKKKQEIIQRKKELIESKRQEKLKRKAEAQAKKQAIRLKKLEQKQERLREKKDLAEAKRRAKLAKIEEAKAKKLAIKQEKLANKEDAIREKKKLIQRKLKAKRDKKNEARARKEAIRRKKLKQKQEGIQQKKELIEQRRKEKLAKKKAAIAKKKAIREKKLAEKNKKNQKEAEDADQEENNE